MSFIEYSMGYAAGIEAEKRRRAKEEGVKAGEAAVNADRAPRPVGWYFEESGPISSEVWKNLQKHKAVPKTASRWPFASKPVSLPENDALRKEMPMAEGLLYYFPNALAEVAKVSKLGNDKHNPGQPVHWAREKSKDHANKIMRHLVDAGAKDGKGVRHSAYLAWRALALLQIELEEQEGVPRPRNAY